MLNVFCWWPAYSTQTRSLGKPHPADALVTFIPAMQCLLKMANACIEERLCSQDQPAANSCIQATPTAICKRGIAVELWLYQSLQNLKTKTILRAIDDHLYIYVVWCQSIFYDLAYWFWTSILSSLSWGKTKDKTLTPNHLSYSSLHKRTHQCTHVLINAQTHMWSHKHLISSKAVYK